MSPTEVRSGVMKENLAFLDSQMLMEPSVNEQIGFDFQGLRRSFREDPKHPDSRLVAQFGRVWLYDVSLSIYADLKAGRLWQAGYQVGRVMQLARQEEARGFRGLWHFSYNTRGDSFIDPRGPTGANAWCLNAVYAYLLARPDASLLEWANRSVREFLFRQQVMEPEDPRYGLIRAGLHNADETLRSEEMGYRVYQGNLNHPYQHVILEHCADAAGAFRLAFRVTEQMQPPDQGPFLEELIHRHDLLIQGMRRCFWQEDHFVSALDPQGRLYPGTDGVPSVAVDNNSWSAHVILPYDPDAALAAARYVERRFLIETPPAQVEDLPPDKAADQMKGLYYFTASFQDPFVQVSPEHRSKMERMLHPEAAFGFVVFLLGLAKSLPAEEGAHWKERAAELYEHTVKLLRLYGPSGAPYASVNIPAVFSTLHSVTTAASSVIVTAILHGAPADDFVGVRPPERFTVAGRPPQ